MVLSLYDNWFPHDVFENRYLKKNFFFLLDKYLFEMCAYVSHTGNMSNENMSMNLI